MKRLSVQAESQSLLKLINIVGTGPAVMNPSSTNEEREPPPAYTKSGQQQISTADFQVY